MIRTSITNILSIITVLLLTFAQFFSSDIFNYIAIICAMIITVYDYELLIPLICITYLNSKFFLIGDMNVCTIILLIFIVTRIINVFKGNAVIISQELLIPIILLIILVLYVIFDNIIIHGKTGDLLNFIYFALLTISLATMITDKSNVIFSNSVGLICVLQYLLLIFYVLGFFPKYVDIIEGSIKATPSEHVNPNQFAVSEALSLIIIVLFIVSQKRNINKAVYIVAAGICGIYLLMTGARTALIGMAVSLLLAYFMRGDKTLTAGNIATLIVVAVTGYLIFDMNILGLQLGRYSVESIVESNGSSRFDIWQIAIDKIITKYPWFGIGYDIQGIHDITERYFGAAYGTHNGIIEILSLLGIIGATIFYGMIATILSRLSTKRKNELIIGVKPILYALIAILIMSLGEDISTHPALWFLLGFSMFLINNSAQHEYQK